MKTERERQQQNAMDVAAVQGSSVWRYHFLCSDGEAFSAIAPTEDGARRVLNAERPGIYARFEGYTHCPIETRAAAGIKA